MNLGDAGASVCARRSVLTHRRTNTRIRTALGSERLRRAILPLNYQVIVHIFQLVIFNFEGT